jgi:tetratricopeptide (TPR) repeat protein
MGNDSDNGFKEIKPVPFQRTPEIAADGSGNSKNISTKTLIIGTVFLLILVSLVIVIFFLPDWVKKPEIINSKKQANDVSIDVSSQIDSSTTTVTGVDVTTHSSSSNEQIKDMDLRKETQSYLQQSLEKQNILKKNNAQIWATEEYTQGLKQIESGDRQYNQQNFSQATKEYQTGLAIFNKLVDQIDIIYNKNIEQGQNALDTGNTLLAFKAFKTAALFTDESQLAAKGLARTQILDDVFVYIKQANEALESSRLVDAKKAFQSALDLDPDTKVARQKLQETNELLANKQFSTNMTAGYAALEQQNFNTAIIEFNKALKIKPASTSAKTALQQTEHKATALKIANTLNEAADKERNEQWQDAIDLYSSALKLESNLINAETGKQRAQNQLTTYKRLEKILSEPERLNDKNVHADVTTYYNEVRNVNNPGPVLTKQLNDLENLLRVSATPIKISLESDNMTDVILYKVGKMGAFESKELSLRPGKYVAVGKRDGYRDVRIEFIVAQTSAQKIVRIAATEKIN